MPAIVEKYMAKVVDNQDDEKRGRIKVICPDFSGSSDSPLSSWVEPAFDWGWFYVPDIDEIVEIEIVVSHHTDEQYGQTKIWNPNIKWRGIRYWGGTENENVANRPIPADFRDTNYGKRRGFSTPAGHTIIFDDTEELEEMKISWKQGDNSSYITFDSNGIIVVDKFGNQIEMKDGQITVQSNKVVLSADTEPAVLGNQMASLHDGHTHPSAFGPTGTPTPNVPFPTNNIKSTKVSLD